MGEIDEATPNLNILVHSESDGEAEQSTQLRRTIIYRHFPKGVSSKQDDLFTAIL